MASLQIPTDLLHRLGPNEKDARVEIAVRLYETGSLKFDEAARLADLTLELFADACAARRVPVYWVTTEDLESDLETLKKMGI